MKAWSSWYDDLMPSLPGCSTALVDHELLRASQEFFTRSRAWGVILDPVTVSIGETEIDVLPDDSQQAIVRIERATWNGNRLDVGTPGEIEDSFGDDWMDQTGTPSFVTQLLERTLRLVATPSTSGSLRCRVTVRPSDTSTGLPDALAFQYRNAITVGSKSRLMLMPEKPWTNEKLGGLALGQFESAITDAMLKAQKTFGKTRNAAKPQWC